MLMVSRVTISSHGSNNNGSIEGCVLVVEVRSFGTESLMLLDGMQIK